MENASGAAAGLTAWEDALRPRSRQKQTRHPPARGQTLHALLVERDGTLTEPEPPVRLRVGADAFPIGIAAFERD